MSNKTAGSSEAPRSKAQDQKRAAALRQNLLKRKQQSRSRKEK